MTQLLISVKDVEESLIARYAGVDLIDLKDPSVGALGALDLGVVRQAVAAVNGCALISATVGEGHASVDELVVDIKAYASLGVDVVKLAVSHLFQESNFLTEMQRLTAVGIKLVAVCFADAALDFSVIPELQKVGFYGAMLDTQTKQQTLLDRQPIKQLELFVRLCEKHHLVSGLAGSVNKEHMDSLLALNPGFIGLRGGVCHGNIRTTALAASKVSEVVAMLLNYNTKQQKIAKTSGLDLHI